MYLLQYVYHSTQPYSKTTTFNLVIIVLPFNRNFSQNYTIFNRHIINIFVLLLFTILKKAT